MAHVTKRIGLSLGADLCWPICYEALMDELKLSIDHGGDTHRVDVERVSIEPFDLQQDCPYDLVIDRLTHWFHTSREWIKKSVLMDDLYVFNNPWSIQSMEKQTSYCAMMRLGLPIPATWLIPPKEHEPYSDLHPTLMNYAKLFDLGKIGEEIGYPLFMKPYDGGAWVGVTKLNNEGELNASYDQSGKRVMHLQKGVLPHDRFIRCVGLGPQVRFVNYNPAAPLHNRYGIDLKISDDDKDLLRDITLIINSFFGWDFNSCESLRHEGTWMPIDFANPCPDSQVTSVHYHFPWIVMANIRWSVFCAVTGRSMRQNLNWQPYFEIAKQELSYRDRIRAYAAIAKEHFQVDAFEAFCETHLGHLDDVAFAFFATSKAKEAVRGKVAAMFPAHEVEEFTELFWSRIQLWREQEGAFGECA